jgi:hypothetical protein
MTKRLLRWIIVFILLVLFVATSYIIWPRKSEASPITKANYGRINASMSLVEIEAILGPPGDYTMGPTDYGPNEYVYFDRASVGSGPVWESDEARISVSYSYDASPHLIQKSFAQGFRVEQSSMANLYWRAQRQWRRWFPEKDPL